MKSGNESIMRQRDLITSSPVISWSGQIRGVLTGSTNVYPWVVGSSSIVGTDPLHRGIGAQSCQTNGIVINK